MFIDNIKLKFIAGKGGDGIVAFRREKYLPKGGPYGGDGGKGGCIILTIDNHLLSLEKFFGKQKIKAENGQNGQTNNKKGKNGKDLIIKIPLGTIIKDTSGNIIFEFIKPTDQFVICKGGKGGKGNFYFRSSTNQTPNFCQKGEIGEEKKVELDLKIIADIGLVGMPNAGKSTLLKQLTKSKVKIASYPFTTLCPNIGLIKQDNFPRMFIADIPGLIKGAHLNKGLGISFLKHIERTLILLFIIDSSSNDPHMDFLTLLHELTCFNKKLLKKPFLTVLNKIDLQNTKNIENFKKKYSFSKNTLIEISALNNFGLDILLQKLKKISLSR